MTLDKQALLWIKQEFEAGRTAEEIALDTGYSKPTVKRALAEQGVLNLSWHKSKAQHELLTYLERSNIKCVEDLTPYKLVKR